MPRLRTRCTDTNPIVMCKSDTTCTLLVKYHRYYLKLLVFSLQVYNVRNCALMICGVSLKFPCKKLLSFFKDGCGSIKFC